MINTNFPHICIQGNNSTILCTFLKCFWFMQIFSNADTGKPYHILFWEKYFSAFQIRSKKYLSVGHEIRRTIASYSYVGIMREREVAQWIRFGVTKASEWAAWPHTTSSNGAALSTILVKRQHSNVLGNSPLSDAGSAQSTSCNW